MTTIYHQKYTQILEFPILHIRWFCAPELVPKKCNNRLKLLVKCIYLFPILTTDSNIIESNLFYYSVYYKFKCFALKKAVDVRVKNQWKAISLGNGLLKSGKCKLFGHFRGTNLIVEKVWQSLSSNSCKIWKLLKLRQPSHRGILRFSKQVVNPCLKS